MSVGSNVRLRRYRFTRYCGLGTPTLTGLTNLFWRIILPLAKPALATVSLFTFLANWRDFLAPLIFLQTNDLFTLSLGLQQYQSLHQTAWAYLMAASVIFVLPVAVVFLAAQRFFIRGITLSGLKVWDHQKMDLLHRYPHFVVAVLDLDQGP